MARKACQGDGTISVGDMEECASCEKQVRHDLVDHSFFGFRQTCPDYEPPDDDGEAFRGGEAAAFDRQAQADIQRDLKR